MQLVVVGMEGAGRVVVVGGIVRDSRVRAKDRVTDKVMDRVIRHTATRRDKGSKDNRVEDIIRAMPCRCRDWHKEPPRRSQAEAAVVMVQFRPPVTPLSMVEVESGTDLETALELEQEQALARVEEAITSRQHQLLLLRPLVVVLLQLLRLRIASKLFTSLPFCSVRGQGREDDDDEEEEEEEEEEIVDKVARFIRRGSSASENRTFLMVLRFSSRNLYSFLSSSYVMLNE